MKRYEEITGVYWDSGRRFGFVTPEGAEGREEDIFIPPHGKKHAWHGDTVTVLLDGGRDERGRPSGRVTAIVERGNPSVVGELSKIGREYYLTPVSRRLGETIHITGAHSGLRAGELAEVKMLSYGSRGVMPAGEFIRSFGKAGTRQAAVEAILCREGIDREFRPETLRAAAAAPKEVSPEAFRDRLDLRGTTIITMDGATAKDLDDAVSLRRRESGEWELGVHIADVSFYVAAGSPLDEEALERGTSVYFADQVIPMLPPELSNGICSLHPQVDRLTLSCLMTLSPQGEVIDRTICKSVIRTVERMNYSDCNALLAGESWELAERYAHILPMLQEMAELARTLRKKRLSRGALELESRECDILCDEQGAPVEIRLHDTGESEGVIEEFMLAANETVAEYLCKNHLPGVFRIHEKPTSEKLERVQKLVEPFGLTLTPPNAAGMAKLLREVRGEPEEMAVNMMLLRSMMKARYSAENTGHFGLGAEFYCHFTSPIRRYPDLMVHRILSAVLEGKPIKKLAAQTEEAARQSSLRELAAQTAEREIEASYLADYMTHQIGEEFVGVISGVTKAGFFVLLPNGVEGRVALEALPEDYYLYDESHLCLKGQRTGRSFAFGMEVAVVCAAADPGAGEVGFTLVGQPGREKRRRTAEDLRWNGKKDRHGGGKSGGRRAHSKKRMGKRR